MAYEVIARRWRPQTFEAVVGQAHVTTTLRNAISLERLAHAYLFVGPRGVGKTSTARILAKAINCAKLSKDGQPCDACDACVSIREGSAIDVVEIDAASNNSVDDIRELRERVRFPPAVAKRKVYIIDEVHMLSTAAFNAFLKTLEEPPDHCLFIMATTEVHKIPATILSRCQRFDFRRITTRDIAERLGQICTESSLRTPADQGLLLEIARAGDGSMRDAESLLDQIIACGDQAVTTDGTELVLGSVSFDAQRAFMNAIRTGDAPSILRHVAEIAASGKDLHQFVRDLAAYARNLMVAKEAGNTSLLDLGAEQARAVLEQAQDFPPGAPLKLLDTFMDLDARFRHVASGRIALELAALKLARWGGAVDASDLIERLVALETKYGGDAPSPPPPAGGMGAASGRPRPRASSARNPAPSGAPARAPRAAALGGVATPGWEPFMAMVKQEKQAAFFHAKNGRLGRTDGGTVQIVLPDIETYNKDFLTNPSVRPVLEQAAARVWGGPRRVEILLEAESGPAVATAHAREPVRVYEDRPSATVSAEPVPDDPPLEPEDVLDEHELELAREDEVLRDPLVRHILERFEGRIIGIDG